MSNRIKIVDSFMGSGKTTWAINYINSLPDDKKIIYITPFLSEIKDRVLIECASKNLIEPNADDGNGRKMNHLIDLVQQGKNIASTHALFTDIDNDLINALKANDYILILDETLNIIERFSLYTKTKKMNEEVCDRLTIQDIKVLIEKGFLKVSEDDYALTWEDEEHPLSKYSRIKKMADKGFLYFIEEKLLVWTFPIEVFRPGIFEEIYILTYKFNYQMQSYYYRFYDLDFEIYHIERINGKSEIVPTESDDYELEWKEKIKSLIQIIDNPKMNRIGDSYYDARNMQIKTVLSSGWFDDNKIIIKNILKNNVNNFFKHYSLGSRVEERMWTCYKKHTSLLQNNNLSVKTTWVEENCRATNKYEDRFALAYLINKYDNPYFEKFFYKKKITVDKDKAALADMVQWIWRSRIRKFQSIVLYLPSERMRTLLLKWINNENIKF